MLRGAVSIAAILAGCAGDVTVPESGPAETHGQLTQGSVFLFDPERSAAVLHAAVHLDGVIIGTYEHDLPVAGGVVVAGVDEDDDLLLDELTLSFGPVRVQGIPVGGIVLRVRQPVSFASTEWSPSDQVVLATSAAPLATIEARVGGPDPLDLWRITTFDLDLIVLPDVEGRLELVVSGMTTSFVWAWGPYVVTSSLEATMDGFVPRDD
jgi:hypothetical protein